MSAMEWRWFQKRKLYDSKKRDHHVNVAVLQGVHLIVFMGFGAVDFTFSSSMLVPFLKNFSMCWAWFLVFYFHFNMCINMQFNLCWN